MFSHIKMESYFGNRIIDYLNVLILFNLHTVSNLKRVQLLQYVI